MWYECHLKFYKLSLNFNQKKTYKEFCECLGTGLCNIWWFVFWVLDPSILKGHNFINYIPFLTISNALDTLIGGVQVLFRCKKKWSPPLGFGMPWVLKCYNCNSIAINEQLKNLTHMFCFLIPCYKLYEKGLLFYVLTLKYMCHLGMSWKKLNLKAKHKIKNKISWLLFNAFSLVFSYLFTYLGK
jgi:hypothetical protein